MNKRRDKGLKENDPAPDFSLKDKDENLISLKDFRGKWVVLYFYPKDNTPGCTIEAIDFTKNLSQLSKLNAVVIGISPDSCSSHQNFAKKHSLKVTLLSDTEKSVLKKYGVWQKKKRFGKEYYGVVRTTFLLNPEGKIAHLWRNVKVKGHIEDVKMKLKEMAKG